VRKPMLGRRLAALVVGLASSALLVSGTASAEPAGVRGVPVFGVTFVAEQGANGGQCKEQTNPGSTQVRWTTVGDWTPFISVDTDDRGGGCQLAFGFVDNANDLAGFGFSYQLTPTSGAESQCGTNYAENFAPTNGTTGSRVRLDSDNRGGWCDATLRVYGTTNYVIDVRFYGSNQLLSPSHPSYNDHAQGGQCRNSLPRDQHQTVAPGAPLTLHIDTDGRAGWCNLEFRLRRV
jgi:hypothetical protein